MMPLVCFATIVLPLMVQGENIHLMRSQVSLKIGPDGKLIELKPDDNSTELDPEDEDDAEEDAKDAGEKKDGKFKVSVSQITCCAAEDTFNDGSPAHKEGREYDKAWDGSTATYYDAKKGNGYTGADLKGAYVITAIKYFWRKGGETIQARQDNGKFQASNDKSTWTDLAQTSSSQGAGWVELANITDETAYRYIRFKGADGSYVNVAEIALFGYPAAKGNATKYAGEKKDGKDKAATDKVAMAAKAAKPVADAVAAVANAAAEMAVYQAAKAGARAALGGKADKYGKKAKGMKEGNKTKEGNKRSKKDEDKADEAGANETVDEEQTDE